MNVDLDRSDPARTPRSQPDTRTPDRTAIGAPDAEAFDHLEGHELSRPASFRPVASVADRMARWRGGDVRWVRACDALAQSAGKATGRSITWTAQANRLPRLAPLRQAGTGRRAIARASAATRTSKLAPVAAFGTRREPSTARTGVSR